MEPRAVLGDDDGLAEEWQREELLLGLDTGARLLETVVLVLEKGEEMVIHAMPHAKKYLDRLP